MEIGIIVRPCKYSSYLIYPKSAKSGYRLRLDFSLDLAVRGRGVYATVWIIEAARQITTDRITL